MCGNNIQVNKDMRHNSQTNRVISGSFAARRVIEGLFDSLLLQSIMLHGGQPFSNKQLPPARNYYYFLTKNNTYILLIQMLLQFSDFIPIHSRMLCSHDFFLNTTLIFPFVIVCSRRYLSRHVTVFTFYYIVRFSSANDQVLTTSFIFHVQ